jgi:hypothetical protein
MTQISLTSPAAVTILLDRSKIFSVAPGISSYLTVAIPAESVAQSPTAATDYGPYLADREVTLNLVLGTVVYEVKESAGGGAVSAASIVTALDAATPEELAEIQYSVSGAAWASFFPRALNAPHRQMASPPAVSTSTSGTQVAGGSQIPIWTNGNASQPFAAGQSFLSRVSAAAGAQVLGPVSVNAAGTTFQNQSLRYLINFDGTEIEFKNQSAGGSYWIKVNDEYIDQAGTALPADSANRWIKVTFSVRTQARVEFVSYGLDITEINVDPTAGVSPAPIRGPRMIIQGDSFNGTAQSYPRVIADMLGWDDVWNSGMGGTGMIATNGGLNKSYEQRLARDVIAFAPDVFWQVGSVNDNGATPENFVAAAQRCRSAYLEAVPRGLYVWSPNASNGPCTWTANQIAIRRAMRTAMRGLPNTLIVDPLELPIATRGVVPSATLAANVAVGATSIQVMGTQSQGGYPPPGSVIQIDSELFEIKSGAFGGTVGADYKFTLQIAGAAKSTHAAGAIWTLCGASYITGAGSAGTPAGWGNSDLYRISTGDLHPTTAGQRAFAAALANALIGEVQAAT